MNYAKPDYLISTADLDTAIANNPSRLRLFDVTISLVPSAHGYNAVSGFDDYQQAHIPGTAFLDIVRDLSDTSSGLGFTLPSAAHLQAAYRAAGIDDEQIVELSGGHLEVGRGASKILIKGMNNIRFCMWCWG